MNKKQVINPTDSTIFNVAVFCLPVNTSYPPGGVSDFCVVLFSLLSTCFLFIEFDDMSLTRIFVLQVTSSDIQSALANFCIFLQWTFRQSPLEISILLGIYQNFPPSSLCIISWDELPWLLETTIFHVH